MSWSVCVAAHMWQPKVPPWQHTTTPHMHHLPSENTRCAPTQCWASRDLAPAPRAALRSQVWGVQALWVSYCSCAMCTRGVGCRGWVLWVECGAVLVQGSAWGCPEVHGVSQEGRAASTSSSCNCFGLLDTHATLACNHWRAHRDGCL